MGETEIPARYNASELLFGQVERGRGAAVAIRCEGRTVTYGELATLATEAGAGLRSLGLSRGDRILLVLLDTPELPAVFFGAMRVGLIPVLASTALSAAEYTHLLQDSGARAVIVSEPLIPALIPAATRAPVLDHLIVCGDASGDDLCGEEAAPGSALTFSALLERGRGGDCGVAASSRDTAAFWLYSSGSTGVPKGVVHRHRAIPFTVATYAEEVLEISEHDRTFSASKAFHAYGLGNNITFPYAAGAETVLFSGRPTPEAIFAQIERYAPTLFFAVPTLYAAMLDMPDAERFDLASVRLCVSAAEALPADIYHRWRERFGVEILDGIGSTELLHIFISNRSGAVTPGATGHLVPGYQARIVDEHGDETPSGVAGDLLVQGGSAAASYWNRPEQSEQTMRGEDWISTGDRYYSDAAGCFYYQGRSDDMLKVGGQWVSPVEVENTLVEHVAVLEAAVVGVRDGAGLTKPRAFVVLRQGMQPSDALAEELRSFVCERIAPYKHPRTIAFIDRLPKTVTGKIQRFKLRQAAA